MRETVESIALLVIRGVLLWIVLPLAAVLWFVSTPIRLITRKPLGLRRFVGWVDLNLIALLQRTVLRPLAVNPHSFVAWSYARTVEQRVRLTDLV